MHAEHTIVCSECTLCRNTFRAYSKINIIILLIHTLNACRVCHCILRVYSRHTQRAYSGILELYSECTLVCSEFPKHFLKGFWVYIGTLHQSILRVCSEACTPLLSYELAGTTARDVSIRRTQQIAYAPLAMVFRRHAKHLNPSLISANLFYIRY